MIWMQTKDFFSGRGDKEFKAMETEEKKESYLVGHYVGMAKGAAIVAVGCMVATIACSGKKE